MLAAGRDVTVVVAAVALIAATALLSARARQGPVPLRAGREDLADRSASHSEEAPLLLEAPAPRGEVTVPMHRPPPRPAPPASNDAIGVERRIDRLLGSIDRYENADTPEARDAAGFDLATRCVAEILTWHGRADLGTAEERATKAFSTKPEYEDQWVFLADSARFRFDRGEFPAYDRTRTRLSAILQGGPGGGPFPEELDEALDALGDEALRCLMIEKSR